MNAILVFMGLGMQELLLIGFVILVFFGARKIPEFMKGLGKGVREFKEGIREVNTDPAPPARTSTTSTPPTPPTDETEEDGKRD
jgi:sec-independent protein translocase protein TatA